MRGSCACGVVAVLVALAACSRARPALDVAVSAPASGVGGGAGSGSDGETPIWPVPWSGTFMPHDALMPNLISPDGRFAVVTPMAEGSQQEPTLFRLEPDGPVATLSMLTGTKVLFPEWRRDSRRIHVGLRGEPQDIDYRDVTQALLDLGTLSVQLEGKIPWDPVEGYGAEPDSDCSSPTKDAPLLLCLAEPASASSQGGFVVGVRRGGKVERPGPKFRCEPGNTQSSFSAAGDALAIRCKDELLIARPGATLVRIALDERARQLGTLVWSEGARTVALGGRPDCALERRCPDPGGPHVFDARSGREVPAADFHVEPPAWVIIGSGPKLWADHRWERLRRPLPGTPPFLVSGLVRFQSETRVTLQAAVPPVRYRGDDQLREVELELATARVLSSKPTERTVYQKPPDPPPSAVHHDYVDDGDLDRLDTRIVVGEKTLATGRLLGRERGLVTLRTAEGRVELWTEEGRRLGLLPGDVRQVPHVSPSGALGIEPHGDCLRLIRLATGEALSLYLVRVGERTFGVARSPAGWFAGDPEAFAALRFARGKSLLEAEPLTGSDVRAELERPALLADFLAGRAVPLAPVGVLGRAR